MTTEVPVMAKEVVWRLGQVPVVESQPRPRGQGIAICSSNLYAFCKTTQYITEALSRREEVPD